MIEFNREQQMVINAAIDWFYTSNEQIFQYDGPPGSGKSLVLNEIIRSLGLNPLTEVAAMSFIGSASLVMRNKGLYNARTAHSWLYTVREVILRDDKGNPKMDELLNVPIKVPKFIPVDELDPNIKLIVIDEAYSMPYKLKKDIEKFGIKIIACGDQGQLPPVNDSPAYLARGKIYHLTKCMRQLGREDINYIATRAGKGLPLINGYYGNSIVIDKNDLTIDMLLWADAVICTRNDTRDKINNKIRKTLGYTTDIPMMGEKVVCRSNNWLECIYLDNGSQINPVNGLICRVLSQPDVSSFDGKLFSMTFYPELAPQAIFNESRCNYLHMISDSKTRTNIRNNRYQYGNMFEYAYAITAHVAQGSQFHKVVYIEEPFGHGLQNSLNLVGASRADEALIYVKP